MHDPELLILDEPTSGLDPLRQQDVLELIRERAAAGRTVVPLLARARPGRARRRTGGHRQGRPAGRGRGDLALKRRAVRRVEVRLAGPSAGCGAAARRPGGPRRRRRRRRRRLDVEGSMDALVKELAKLPVQSLTSEPPELDEIFLTYYGRVACRLRSSSSRSASGAARCSGGRSGWWRWSASTSPSTRRYATTPALSNYGEDLPDRSEHSSSDGELDLASPAGYLNSQIYALLAPLLLLIFSIGGGAGAVAGEEERGTLDLLLAHPVRRRDYVSSASWRLRPWSPRCGRPARDRGARLGARRPRDRLRQAAGRVRQRRPARRALRRGRTGRRSAKARTCRRDRRRCRAGCRRLAPRRPRAGGRRARPVRPLSPFYQALGRNPLRDGVPWTGWVVLVA